MAKKRRFSRKLLNRLAGIGVFSLYVGSGALVIAAANDLGTFFQLRNEISANEVLLEQTKTEQEELETTRKNLTNPDYLEFVARGKYHVSRYGEQVFVFPELSEDSSNSASTDSADSAQSSQSE